MRPLKSLTLEALVSELSSAVQGLHNLRVAERLDYSLPDTLMKGFALMFFQRSSLLQFQRAMQQKRRRCNLETIFGVHEVPSDTQMREILDGVEPEGLWALLPLRQVHEYRHSWITSCEPVRNTAQRRRHVRLAALLLA